jgi:hypothetical protein
VCGNRSTYQDRLGTNEPGISSEEKKKREEKRDDFRFAGIYHTTGCELTGSLAGGDEACLPVADQCDTGTASWQRGQAYAPGDIATPSTTCPDGCIFQKARAGTKRRLLPFMEHIE